MTLHFAANPKTSLYFVSNPEPTLPFVTNPELTLHFVINPELTLHFLQIRIRFVLFLGKKGLTESLHDSSIESILLRRKIKKNVDKIGCIFLKFFLNVWCAVLDNFTGSGKIMWKRL